MFRVRTRCLGLLLVALVAVAAVPAQALVVTYTFKITTLNGTPVTDLALYASDSDGNDAVILPPDEIPASGVSSLSFEVDFVPTEALGVGISQRGSQSVWDIVMFTTHEFADFALGKRFDEAFPSFGFSHPLGHLHANLPGILQGAHAGDATDQANLGDILRADDAQNAYFDPFGPFSIIHFTIVPPPIGGSIPEPATLGILGIGAALVLVVRLRRGRDTARRQG